MEVETLGIEDATLDVVEAELLRSATGSLDHAPAKSLTITRPVDPTSAAAENPMTPVPAARSGISSPGDGSRSASIFSVTGRAISSK